MNTQRADRLLGLTRGASSRSFRALRGGCLEENTMPYKDKEKGRENKRQYAKAHKQEALARSRLHYQRHKEEILAACKEKYKTEIDKHTEWHIRNRYGITTEDYNAMFIHQQGRCAICGRHQSELNQRLCIDHSHKNGVVRGLLCRKCNAAIGLFGDNVELMKTALVYLEVNDVA